MIEFIKKPGIISALLTAFLFLSCASTVSVNDNISNAELMQRAQEAIDRSRYKTALGYYEVLREKNMTNTDMVITAEYHIAHIHYKQKLYKQAREELYAVIELFNKPDRELYPLHFEKLAQIILQQIDEKESRKLPFSK